MLREHDFFKVVLNPGADKREKWILGQITRNVPSTEGPFIRGPEIQSREMRSSNTGGTMLDASLHPDRGQSAAQLP